MKRKMLAIYLLLLFYVGFYSGYLRSQNHDTPPKKTEGGQASSGTIGHYRTPRAGEAFSTTLLGIDVKIEKRDRSRVTALSLGSSFFKPTIAGNFSTPFAAFFLRRHWEDNHQRFRAVLSGVVNYIDYEDGSWNNAGIEFLLHFHNHTVPVARSIIIGGEEIKESSIYWGRVLMGIGIGWRTQISPFHFDNDLRIQLRYEPEFFYNMESSDTADNTELPPNTYVHSAHLLIRMDALERNLLELPHEGWAFGLDLIVARRTHWRDQYYSDQLFKKEDTRDYVKLTAYTYIALGIPHFSERHRLLLFFSGGLTPDRNLDRYTAFRLGGGPEVSESNDLTRHPMPGSLFDQFTAGHYILSTIEYRFEALFFLYLHARATLAWAGATPEIDDNQKIIRGDHVGLIFSCAVTTGFIWDSMLYLEYAYDKGTYRYGSEGHSFLFNWSKSF